MRRLPVRSFPHDSRLRARYGEKDYKDDVYGDILESLPRGSLGKLTSLQVFQAKEYSSREILDYIFQVLSEVAVFLRGLAAAPPWGAVVGPAVAFFPNSPKSASLKGSGSRGVLTPSCHAEAAADDAIDDENDY